MTKTVEQKVKLLRLAKGLDGGDFLEGSLFLDLQKQIDSLSASISSLDIPEQIDLSPLNSQIAELYGRVEELRGLMEQEDSVEEPDEPEPVDVETPLMFLREEIIGEIEKLRQRINNLPQRGGSMNRQVLVEGADPLTTYTDFNLQGTAASITAAKNITKKNVDFTFPFGALNFVTKATDYTLNTGDYTVEFTAAATATLPTAVGVTGRTYVIKNSGTGLVTLNTTSGQTIDDYASGALTLSQYESLTLVSDNANWIIV